MHKKATDAQNFENLIPRICNKAKASGEIQNKCFNTDDESMMTQHAAVYVIQQCVTINNNLPFYIYHIWHSHSPGQTKSTIYQKYHNTN